jgi:hypothetical protein
MERNLIFLFSESLSANRQSPNISISVPEKFILTYCHFSKMVSIPNTII